MATSDFFKDFAFDPDGIADQGGVPLNIQRLLHEAAQVRGWCVQSFAQVEFMLAYLVDRSRQRWPQHYGDAKWSYSPSARPQRVRELLMRQGPLHSHAEEIEKILLDMADFEDFRHMLAHGWGDVVQAKNGVFLRWRRYTPKSGRPQAITITSATIETFRDQGEAFVRFASAAVNYFQRLFLHYGLEEPGPDAAL